MLFDPRHDKTPTIPGFAIFCASKPANQAYNWSHCCMCAVGQYLESLGLVPFSVKWEGEIQKMNLIAQGPIETGQEKHWTFGKCAERILAYQMAEKV